MCILVNTQSKLRSKMASSYVFSRFCVFVFLRGGGGSRKDLSTVSFSEQKKNCPRFTVCFRLCLSPLTFKLWQAGIWRKSYHGYRDVQHFQLWLGANNALGRQQPAPTICSTNWLNCFCLFLHFFQDGNHLVKKSVSEPLREPSVLGALRAHG